MKELKAKDGSFLRLQGKDDERIYVKAVTGANINEDEWVDASSKEMESYTSIDGCNTYDEVLKKNSEIEDEIEKVRCKINYIGLTSNQALSVKELFPRWEDRVGSTIDAGFITLYDGNLWKARQTHTALEVYPPSIDTAALYEIVEYKHEGTQDDPIPYIPPMEIFEGKYYTQDNVLYLCTRDSGTALSHNLQDLINIYVSKI